MNDQLVSATIDEKVGKKCQCQSMKHRSHPRIISPTLSLPRIPLPQIRLEECRHPLTPQPHLLPMLRLLLPDTHRRLLLMHLRHRRRTLVHMHHSSMLLINKLLSLTLAHPWLIERPLHALIGLKMVIINHIPFLDLEGARVCTKRQFEDTRSVPILKLE